jgi:hypothetical protein
MAEVSGRLAAAARAHALAEELKRDLERRGLRRADVEQRAAARAAIAVRRTPRPYMRLAADLAGLPPLGDPGDAVLVGLQNRLLAAELVAGFTPANAHIVLPEALHATYAVQQARIVAGLEERDDPAFYQPGNDDFLKELAILAHRLVPHGRGFSDPWGRVSREVFYRGGLAQAVRAARFFGFETRGLGPFLTLHLHTLALPPREDTAEAWAENHEALAAIVALNPQLRGEAGAGWLMDPRIAEVAPHNAYRRQVVVDGGAQTFFLRRDIHGTSGALATSKTRRELFERGEYIPEIWAFVWSRKRLLRWAAGRQARRRPA